MRHNRSTLVLSVLTTIALFIGLSVLPSSAAPSAYPPAPGPGLAVSTTNPVAGGPMTISSSGWKPGITITITIHSKVVVLGTTKASSSGIFNATVTIPSYLTGHHTIIASSPDGHSMSISVEIAAAGAAASAPGSGNSSGGLPFTGIDVYALLGIGVLFMLIGGALVFTNRRRRPWTA